MAAVAILKNHKKNRDITTTKWPIFAKFGTIMQNGILNRQTVKNLNFQNPRWRTAAILKKPLNRHILATVWTILMKFGMVAQIGPLQETNR